MVAIEAFLKVLRGKDKGKGWKLSPRQIYILGRNRECNLLLHDGTVSGIHARLQYQEGVWRVTDLKSRHGTYVNSRQKIIGSKPLFDRDLIRVGKPILEFREYEQLDPPDLAQIDQGVWMPE